MPATKLVIPNTFGWQPDVPDYRDRPFLLTSPVSPAALPKSVDLRPQCPVVLNQGTLGSCTANAIANAHKFAQMKQKEAAFDPSRLFVYYNERKLEGSTNSDSGAQIRDGFKTIAADGVCPETMWPYVITKFAEPPPSTAYVEALNHQALQYSRLDDPRVGPLEMALKQCLAGGYPVVFGFSVYSNFQTQYVARTGDVGMPGRRDSAVGGHAVLLVGYDSKGHWIVMNSWGTGWGLKGFFTMPKEYLTNPNLACDFWKLSIVE